MALLAVFLVVVAAVFHACWNLLAKRSVDKLVFLWWTGVAGSLVFLPFVLWSLPAATWPAAAWGRAALAAGLRAVYFVFLGAAYARGDLSLVYPLARGTAPALVPILAGLLLGETLTPSGGMGVAVVVLGVYTIHLPGLALRHVLIPLRALRSPYAGFAILTGLMTATYSIVDKWNVRSGMPLLAYAYLTIPVAALLLTPIVRRRPGALRREWQVNRWSIVMVAVLMTSSYLLILHALARAPVSYVAPARELSIVFGTVLGAVVLGERHLPQRALGAMLIVIGVVLLALAPASG